DVAANSKEEEKQFIANLVQSKETFEEGYSRYYRFKGLLAGATGDYAAADRAFAEIEARLAQSIDLFDLNLYLRSFGTVTGTKDLPVVGASTAGLLGSSLGQGPLLAATALDPDRPGVKKDLPPILAFREAVAVSVARAFLEDITPPPTLLDLLLSGF